MDITLIPGIMRSKNWAVGARLMESWFTRAAKSAPDYSTPPEFVGMDWALNYKPVKDVYREILDQKLWANPAAKGVLKRQLERRRLGPGTCNVLGNLSKSAPELDDDYVNFRAVGEYYYYAYYSAYFGLDDLTAALGRFVLRVAVAGR